MHVDRTEQLACAASWLGATAQVRFWAPQQRGQAGHTCQQATQQATQQMVQASQQAGALLRQNPRLSPGEKASACPSSSTKTVCVLRAAVPMKCSSDRSFSSFCSQVTLPEAPAAARYDAADVRCSNIRKFLLAKHASPTARARTSAALAQRPRPS